MLTPLQLAWQLGMYVCMYVCMYACMMYVCMYVHKDEEGMYVTLIEPKRNTNSLPVGSWDF